MTKKKLERINGYTVTEEPAAVGVCLVATGECGVFRTEARGKRSVSNALHRLVEMIYQAHKKVVMKKQNGLCINCGLRRQLDCHHKKHRGSQGRDDRIENLEGRCRECHSIAHSSKG